MDKSDSYLEIILDAVRVCANYKPKLGQGKQGGIALEEFRAIYGGDKFYSWFGLDSPLMYAAHKAAGGMTSIYRQIGIGAQHLISQLFQDFLSLTVAQVNWKYEIPGPSEDGKNRTLSLDARIALNDVKEDSVRSRVSGWLATAREQMQIADTQTITGAVFEMRQGYKSKDSKRQNADIANAANAYLAGYVPVVMLFSTQMDVDLVERYTRARWLVLNGTLAGPSTASTYTFMKDVIGFDLAGFFESNSSRIRSEVETVLKALLEPTS